jgi:hypothetical protein
MKIRKAAGLLIALAVIAGGGVCVHAHTREPKPARDAQPHFIRFRGKPADAGKSHPWV